MAKIMVFIDGSWLYKNFPRLARRFGKDKYQLDYGKLPTVLSQKVGAQLNLSQFDVVRTYLFASIPWNVAREDEDKVIKQQNFYDMLKEDYHYEVEIFEIDFHATTLRDDDKSAHPREKCVDVALASHMLYFAAIPYAYDIAVTVVGDGDYMPVLQHVRRLGKRVAIASIRDSCSRYYTDPRDEKRVKDLDIIWLDDHLQELELTYERHQLECQDPRHRGPERKFWTTYHPGKNERVYCDECRERTRQTRARFAEVVQARTTAAPTVCQTVKGEEPFEADGVVSEPVLIGVIGDLDKDETAVFGVVCDSVGRQFYFSDEHLPSDVSATDIKKGCMCRFHILNPPSTEGPGTVRKILSVSLPSSL